MTQDRPDPTTDVQLWDRLQEMFGFGDYDEASEQPFHEFRGVGISKLRAIMKKRGITVEQTWTVACYCYIHQIPVRTYWQLYDHYVEAMRWRRRVAAEERVTAAGLEMAELLDYERPFADSPWPGRALRAYTDSDRAAVITEWRAARGLNTGTGP